MAIASACCCGTPSPARLGQSMLATVETQAARNSRGAGGGSSDGGSGGGGATSGTGAGAGGGRGLGLGLGVGGAGLAATGAAGWTVPQLLSKPASDSAPATPASANARLFRSGGKPFLDELIRPSRTTSCAT
ncbi:hypothetical protein [Massilia glaciei]|uniref:hypothetical protein n=1 Tax=Massilia glaciei TaxID=1524097 RepID=UPI0015E7F3BD|nr:hypothetical protein [Massilia glaciei]